MTALAATPFHGTVYRRCAPEHTGLAITLANNRRHGGRFDPRDYGHLGGRGMREREPLGDRCETEAEMKLRAFCYGWLGMDN